MAVPTHNLYDFIHLTTKRKFLILYFYKWGSRELSDVYYYILNNNQLDSSAGIPVENRMSIGNFPKESCTLAELKKIQPILFCHDQEPLNFDLYRDHTEIIQNFNLHNKKNNRITYPFIKNLNLRYPNVTSSQKKWILLHSELNSDELTKYEETEKFVGAYWWSHAVISRDWFRYAEYDQSLEFTNYKKTFLTYCRDTTGTRQYRKTFLDLVKSQNLTDECQFNSFDCDEITSSSSAIYNVEDHIKTMFSVVLETIFSNRVHLTEKTLRPIACGHPFILAAGHGSLELLRSYGFKTFSPYINEEYDNIADNYKRLERIVSEMKRIATLTPYEKKQLLLNIQPILDHNKNWFFSKDFFKLVTQELSTNVELAFEKCSRELDFDTWWQVRKYSKKNQICSEMNREFTKELVRSLRQQRRGKFNV